MASIKSPLPFLRKTTTGIPNRVESHRVTLSLSEERSVCLCNVRLNRTGGLGCVDTNEGSVQD